MSDVFGDGFRCFHCNTLVLGKPSDHVCPDGTTFEIRIGAINQAAIERVRDIEKELENDRADRNLTLVDRALLKKMKIKW